MCRFLWMIPLFLTQTLYAANVTVSIEPNQVHPGDLLVMSVQMQSDTFAEFIMDLPRSEHLHLVSTEPGVVKLQEGRYVQEHRWILQAVSSGTVQWDSLQAEVHTGAQAEIITIPPHVLTIVSYEGVDDTNEPAQLLDSPVAEEPRLSYVWVLGLLLPLLLIALVLRWVYAGRRT